MTRIFLIPLLAVLGACASLEDFHNMGPDERAQRVCAGSAGYGERSRSLRELNDQIAVSETLLARGYRVYEQCQIVRISVPGATVDCGDATGKALKKCQQANMLATTQQRRVCTEIAVPIDYAYEGGALRDLRMTRQDLAERHEQLTLSCEGRVRSMPADDAYRLYTQDAEY